jgi:hypothetical protein
MDPKRSGRVRLSFIDTLKRFDPLDALLLKGCHDRHGSEPDALEYFVKSLNTPRDEIEISVDNLIVLNCVARQPSRLANFFITAYGRELIRVCSD